jgi:hypothetical protein
VKEKIFVDNSSAAAPAAIALFYCPLLLSLHQNDMPLDLDSARNMTRAVAVERRTVTAGAKRIRSPAFVPSMRIETLSLAEVVLLVHDDIKSVRKRLATSSDENNNSNSNNGGGSGAKQVSSKSCSKKASNYVDSGKRSIMDDAIIIHNKRLQLIATLEQMADMEIEIEKVSTVP